MAKASKPNELIIERVYHFPLKTVWEAWADPKQAANWWGPRGFTLTTHSKDLKNGGHWNYTMHGPDGVDYPNKTFYHEVVPYAKLVYDHGANDHQPPLFRVEVLFTEIGKSTKVEIKMQFESAEKAKELIQFIKKASGYSTWDRLAEYLDKESSGREIFVINQSFSAPINTMYEMWTNPKHFSVWLPPTGFKMEFIRADIRKGGSTFYMMTNGKDVKMYGRTNYIDFQKPTKIVYTQEFCDERENLSRHPMAPVWPASMLTTVVLTDEGPSQTRVTIYWEPHGKATPDEIAAFVNAKPGMTAGWSGSFDKLEEHLSKQ